MDEKLFKVIDNLSDMYVAEAAEFEEYYARRRRSLFVRISAIAACCCIVAGITVAIVVNNIGAGTVIGNSTSITDSVEISEISESTDGEGIVIDLTEEKDDESWLKAPEGFDSFSYDRETYYVSNYEMLYFNGGGPIDYYYDEQLTFDYNEYLEEHNVDDFVYIKARLAGDSLSFVNGKSADIQVTDDPLSLGGVLSPVVIEAIVDARGNDITFEVGDIIYVYEGYFKQNSYYIDSMERYMEEELIPSIEAYPDDKFNNRIYENYRAKYEHYKEHQNDNWIYCYNTYPMEKGKSYLILVKTMPREDLIEECPPLYETGLFIMNLSDDEPDSYGKNDGALLRYSQYKSYWKECKKLYGEYFE
ncbi:MAG: hypothetical protein J1E39_08195 [Eubacterium sp.]|nr:hypothetical protein [Eubacterium sp.]